MTITCMCSFGILVGLCLSTSVQSSMQGSMHSAIGSLLLHSYIIPRCQPDNNKQHQEPPVGCAAPLAGIKDIALVTVAGVS